MKKTKKEIESQKTFLGMPMSWEFKEMFKNNWNKDTDKIILPKRFGIGWTVNFHALAKKDGNEEVSCIY